ncbi:MAG: hypothetical protein A2X49_06540 [Lentisphaerae bacterium GWF2_52_8]|nr:MAG: hypothetical protein A2X49_06540 [Lentisphaerae bacterium GWF2_52_8]
MNPDYAKLIENTLYFLALINPASKIFLLSTADPPYTWPQLRSISIRSSIAAMLILIVLTSAGGFLLQVVFHVEIYSLQLAGGFVLFIIGLNAVRQGRFHENREGITLSDISIVPLAAPLIAGPGTITAAISFSSLNGIQSTILCLFFALIINLILMLTSLHIGKFLDRISAIGPLIRITGLVVTAVAVQMMLTGIASWWCKSIPH